MREEHCIMIVLKRISKGKPTLLFVFVYN